MPPSNREYVLGASALPGGVERTLLLCVRPSGPGRSAWVDIVERHRNGVAGWSGHDRRFAVTARLDDLVPLAALVEARLGPAPAVPAQPGGDPEGGDPEGGHPEGGHPEGGDTADRLAAALTAAAQRGHLAGELAPMGMRQRVADWCARAGVPHRQNNWLPIVRLAPGLSLWFDLHDRWLVRFIERAGDEQSFEVSTEYAATATLTAHLEREYGPSGYDGHPDDQLSHLVAVLAGLAGRGLLGGDRPAGASADQLAAWYAGCGVPYQRSGERRQSLLRVYRENTGCTFTLTLGISSRAGRIWFSEDYDYHARPGDAGREYAYSVKTPYGSLDRLVGYLAARLDLADGGDPQDRLLACFTELVRRGDLAGDRPTEANRDLVTGWFRAAGVPAEPDFWMWMNSD